MDLGLVVRRRHALLASNVLHRFAAIFASHLAAVLCCTFRLGSFFLCTSEVTYSTPSLFYCIYSSFGVPNAEWKCFADH